MEKFRLIKRGPSYKPLYVIQENWEDGWIDIDSSEFYTEALEILENYVCGHFEYYHDEVMDIPKK